MSCATPHCARPPIGAEVFCRDCWRLIPQDDRDAMRMCARSPLYAVGAWPVINGSETMIVHGESGLDVRGVTHIANALHRLEWTMLCAGIGKAVRKRLARKAARARVAGRRAA